VSSHPLRELPVLLRRPACAAVVAGIVLLGLVDAAQVLGRRPLGLVGTLALNTDGVLTYGLAGSALMSAVVVSGYNSLRDLWHVSGSGLYERLSRALLFAVPVALVARAAAVTGVEAGGAVDGLRRGWQWGSVVPVRGTDLMAAQGRQMLAYLIAAAFGALVGLAARSQMVAITVVLATTVPFTPLVGALANRVGPVLDVFPWTPFGALRGALTTNGAIFGQDPDQLRLVSTPAASAVLVVWFTATVAWYLLGTSVRSDRAVLMYVVPLPAAVALVALTAILLPPAMAGHVPWRWAPDWRDAKERGEDSRQVAQRWADLTRADDANAQSLFAVSAPAQVGQDVIEVLTAAQRITVQPESEMFKPDYVRVELTFDPVRRSGNLLLDKAQLQIQLRRVGSDWRIVRVEGPYVHVRVAP
jgi:hypothetical protein